MGAQKVEVGGEVGNHQSLQGVEILWGGQVPQDATAVGVLVTFAQADDEDVGREGRALDDGAGEQGERIPAPAEDVKTDELGPPTDAHIDLGQGDQSTEVLWAPETGGQLEATHTVLPSAMRAELRADLPHQSIGEPKNPTALCHLRRVARGKKSGGENEEGETKMRRRSSRRGQTGAEGAAAARARRGEEGPGTRGGRKKKVRMGVAWMRNFGKGCDRCEEFIAAMEATGTQKTG